MNKMRWAKRKRHVLNFAILIPHNYNYSELDTFLKTLGLRPFGEFFLDSFVPEPEKS